MTNLCMADSLRVFLNYPVTDGSFGLVFLGGRGWVGGLAVVFRGFGGWLVGLVRVGFN